TILHYMVSSGTGQNSMRPSTVKMCYLLQYLHLAEERNMDLAEVLSFLFMLSTVELGRPSSQRFYPTYLAGTLASLPTSTGPSSGPKYRFIVLETNYRIYAYRDIPLQTAVLNLFVALKYRFPNVIAKIQIISYLIAHAHPQTREMYVLFLRTRRVAVKPHSSQDLLLPVTHPGYLYPAFTLPADYELVLNYTKTLKVVSWEHASKCCF
ncbi:transcription factor Tfb2-domain-containing protein, partial [Mycena leptocephala]